MNRIVMVIGAILLIAALVFVNKGISRNSVADHDHDEEEQQSQQDAAKKAPKPSSTPVRELLPPELTGGDMSKAKYRITLGWVYDEKTQPHAEATAQAVQAIFGFASQHQKDVAVEIADLDVPPTDLSPAAANVKGLGLSIQGNGVNVQVAGNPGAPPLTAPEIAKELAKLKF